MSDAPERLWMFKDVLKPFLPGGGKINMGDTEYIRADLYDALRTENERLREPVTVKPLAWEDFSERSSKATAMLLTSYMVQRWSCGRFDLSISAPGYSTGLEGAGGFYDTMDAAKAAAQADFESRIRAALKTKKAPGD